MKEHEHVGWKLAKLADCVLDKLADFEDEEIVPLLIHDMRKEFARFRKTEEYKKIINRECRQYMEVQFRKESDWFWEDFGNDFARKVQKDIANAISMVLLENLRR